MTELSAASITQAAPVVDQIVGLTAHSASPTPALLNGTPAAEEEDYTIKCICNYQDDDGSTVLCEKCETWQHIECYYEKGKTFDENESHHCVDCKRRPLDSKLATERQRAKRLAIDGIDRKIKKPPPKNPKKKVKALDGTQHHAAGATATTNGWPSDRAEAGSPRHGPNGTASREQPPSKRQKTSHKASNSVHSHGMPIKLPPQNRRSASASQPLQSPSKSSNNLSPTEPGKEPYTYEFMHLYDDDPGDTKMQAHLFNDITITDNLSRWSNDVEELAGATHGKKHTDVFRRCENSLDSMEYPVLRKGSKIDESVKYHGAHPKWTFLTVDSDVPKGAIVGELRGKIGHRGDYVQDEANRWEELRHPLPFVFFHPDLPIYIDTRREGTICRYIRRSCQPNVVMKTILENGSDYRFCFVANKDLPAGSELVIAWTPDNHVRAWSQQQLNSGIKTEGSVDESYVMNFYAKVAADFGGCACNGHSGCVIARILAAEHGQANGKAKKSRKSGAHATPHGNGRAANSRSGSEARKHHEEDDQDDSHSASVSSRSKPQSRDMTPSSDNKMAIPGLELSDREKRKIAALEKKELDKSQPPQKKKKRNSGGSSQVDSTSTGNKGPRNVRQDNATDPVERGRTYESSLSPFPNTPGQKSVRRDAHSPGNPPGSSSKSPIVPVFISAVSSSQNLPAMAASQSKPFYVDACIQTDPDLSGDWLSLVPEPLAPRKPYISLTKRLLMKCHKERVLLQDAKDSMQPAKTQIERGNPCLNTDISPRATSASTDIQDQDSDRSAQPSDHIPQSPVSSTTLTVEKPRPPGNSRASQPDQSQGQVSLSQMRQPLPPQLDITTPRSPNDVKPISVNRPVDLRVQLPSKHLPNANSTSVPHSVSTTTPTTAGQSPFLATPTFPMPNLLHTTLPLPGSSPSAGNTSAVIEPSPIKKKLSLGDYFNRRSSNQKPETSPANAITGISTASSGSMVANVTSGNGIVGKDSTSVTIETGPIPTLNEKPLAVLLETAGAEGSAEGSAVMDTPKVEVADPLGSSAVATGK